MNLGFIGTGALTSAIVTGLKSIEGDATSVTLSPRSAAVAALLASRYPDVRVARDNQSVLDDCETIMIAVRPQVAHEVLGELRFRSDHHVISLIGPLSLEHVAPLAAPATHVTKALPMPMIAHRLGATIIHPPDPAATAFFARLGQAIEVADAAEFDALTVVTATYAAYFKYLDTVHAWLKDRVPDAKGRDYIAAVFKALASAPEKAPDAGFMQLSEEYATRGGINEQVLRHLTERKLFAALTEALDGVHARVLAR